MNAGLEGEVSSDDPRIKDCQKVENLLGCGAFAQVYQMPDVTPPLVLKWFSDSEKQELIKNEVENLKRLHHKLVVKTYGVVTEKDRILGIIMGLVENRTLKCYIFSPTITYTVDLFLFWMGQLLGILVYLESQEIIHRDIKPDNILVDQSFQLILSDFGCAKATEGLISVENDGITGSYDVGTTRYKAPELRLLEGDQDIKISYATDLYSAGIVCWEMFERRRLFAKYYVDDEWFDTDSFVNDIQQLKDLREIEELGCFEPIRELLFGCTAIDPQDRHSAASAYDFIVSLRQTHEMFIMARYGRRPELSPTEKPSQKIISKPQEFVDSFKYLPTQLKTGKMKPNDLLDVLGFETTESSCSQTYLTSAQVTEIPTEVKDEKTKEPKKRDLKEIAFLVNQAKNCCSDFDWGAHFRLLEKKLLSRRLNGSLPWLLGWVSAKGVYRLLKNLLPFVRLFIDSYQDDSSLIDCYHSKNGEEWLLVDDVKGSEKPRFRKNGAISQIQAFQGSWRDENFIIEGDDGKVVDEFRFVKGFKKTSSFLVNIVKGSLWVLKQKYIKKESSLLVNSGKCLLSIVKNIDKVFYSETEGQDLPTKGFIFQLGLPPRPICVCEVECPYLEVNHHRFQPPLGFQALHLTAPSCCPQYPEYAVLHAEFAFLLIMLTCLDDFFDLIRAVSLLSYLRRLICTVSCPKIFMIRKLPGNEYEKFILNCIPSDQEQMKVLVCDSDFNFTNEDITVDQLESFKLENIDLENFLNEALTRKICIKFFKSYQRRSIPCSFLKPIGISMNEFNEYEQVISEVCAKFEYIPKSSDRNDEINERNEELLKSLFLLLSEEKIEKRKEEQKNSWELQNYLLQIENAIEYLCVENSLKKLKNSGNLIMKQNSFEGLMEDFVGVEKDIWTSLYDIFRPLDYSVLDELD